MFQRRVCQSLDDWLMRKVDLLINVSSLPSYKCFVIALYFCCSFKSSNKVKWSGRFCNSVIIKRSVRLRRCCDGPLCSVRCKKVCISKMIGGCGINSCIRKCRKCRFQGCCLMIASLKSAIE